MATFAALSAIRSYPSKVVTLYTFGSPRVGNLDFSAYAIRTFGTNKYMRVTHYDDLVPHCPTYETYMFNHAGEEVWFDDPGNRLTAYLCQN